VSESIIMGIPMATGVRACVPRPAGWQALNHLQSCSLPAALACSSTGLPLSVACSSTGLPLSVACSGTGLFKLRHHVGNTVGEPQPQGSGHSTVAEPVAAAAGGSGAGGAARVQPAPGGPKGRAGQKEGHRWQADQLFGALSLPQRPLPVLAC
jgi:hypothetical protein